MGAPRLVVVLGVLATSCASITSGSDPVSTGATTPETAPADVSPGDVTTTVQPELPAEFIGPPIRLVFVGDVMLGRGVAPVVTGDPSSVFEHLRPALVGADLAFGNLESPLTDRRHLTGEFALEADPAAARLLAGAGFDVLNVANNHATDGRPDTVLDTTSALAAAGLASVGGGPSNEAAQEPLVVNVGGVTVGVVAFDNAGGRPATGATAGVNPWDLETAEAIVTELRTEVDIMVVGLHGGVEYLTRPDPALAHVAELLAEWGADVVWGHGAHVAYPVVTFDGDDRTSVVAPGLGNALFDQQMPRARAGTVLEVLVRGDGVAAMRTGRLAIEAGRSSFEAWDDPSGDAVALDGDWWTPVGAWSPSEPPPQEWGASPLRDDADETARSVGDVTGTGERNIVLASRRPARHEPAHDALPRIDWFDAEGRTAHLGVYTAEGRLRWGSALMLQPVDAVVVCDGSMALGFTTMSDPTIRSGGAWFWDGFGFRTAPLLPGATTPTCADIDHDGRADPVLTDRRPADASAVSATND